MELNKYIDHTLLKQDAKLEGIEKICNEAIKYDFASVCVNPCHVAYCYNKLKHSNVKVCTVIGFPLGANTSATKAFETKDAINNGASEIDMVINVGALKDGNYDLVLNDIKAVKEAAGNVLVKVIIETCLLTDEEIVKVCNLSKEANVQFVKTSTGFSTGGATEHAVKLMYDTVNPDLLVKASGGVRSKEDALKMIKAGASRIGTSAGISIVED